MAGAVGRHHHPPPPAPPAVVLSAPATPSAAMALLGAISPEEGSLAGASSVSPSVASMTPSSVSGLSLRVDTGGESSSSSSSNSSNSSISSSPRATPGGGPAKIHHRRKRPSLRLLDISLTTKRAIPTVLNYKSEVARALFTEHYAKSAAPAWQQELMGIPLTGEGLDETKGDDSLDDGNPGLTMVSMHGLAGGIAGSTSSTKPLIDSIWDAADAGNVPILTALLRQVGNGPKARHFNVVGGGQHFDLNNLCHKGSKCSNSPLYVAAKKGHPECVQLLLEAGADPEYKDKEGQTATHAAAANGRVKCLRILVENGADMNAHDNSGNTPIHIACIKYVKDSISLLVELGCNITLMNRQKQTPAQSTKYEGARKALQRSVGKRGW